MRVNRNKHLALAAEFEVKRRRREVIQIETMIAQLDHICTDLGRQIEAEETRARIHDPAHFAYPTFAKAARERCANIQHSIDALSVELGRLQWDLNEAANQQHVA